MNRGKSANTSYDDDDASFSSNDTNPLSDERFIVEGDPDSLVREYLKDLTMQDIRDFTDNTGCNNNGKSMDNNGKSMDNDATFEKEERSPPPQYHLESSRGETIDRLNRYTLQSYFGGREMKDFNLLSKLGTGIKVIDNNNDIPSIGKLVNKKRGKRKKKGSTATVPLEVVGMDIGYGEDASIGGYKYVLMLVDQCTRNSWVYGMHGSSGADVSEALWKFFINAGGFRPENIAMRFR